MQTVLIANRKGGVGKTMACVTVAAALAARGARVAIADADAQQSALGWLSRRPADAAAIRGISWAKAADIGGHPKKLDWLVIDAPGALRGGKAEQLAAEADCVVTPLAPSVFDQKATAAFLDALGEIKRVRKGRAPVHLVINRARRGRALAGLEAFLAELGRPPAARISDRAAYVDLAGQGLSVFDRPLKALEPLRAEWRALIAALAEA